MFIYREYLADYIAKYHFEDIFTPIYRFLTDLKKQSSFELEFKSKNNNWGKLKAEKKS